MLGRLTTDLTQKDIQLLVAISTGQDRTGSGSRMSTDSTQVDRRRAGVEMKRHVLGDDNFMNPATQTGPVAEMYDWIDRNVWGDIWTRDVLDLRMRSALTIAVLTALRADPSQLNDHMRGGIHNGLTVDEISEIVFHTGAYAGFPASVR